VAGIDEHRIETQTRLVSIDGATRSAAELSLSAALAFAERQGLESYDPYDFKGSPILMRTHRMGQAGRALRTVIYGFAFLAPVLTRRLLGVKPTASPGGVAHLCSAYCELFRLRGKVEHLTRAKELGKWLIDHPGRSEIGLGWGLPFSWQSYKVIPANSAIGHSTMTVGNALSSLEELDGSPEWRLCLDQACVFLTKGLNRRAFPDGSLCLSYTPLDQSQCINSNADIATLLLRCGLRWGREDLTEEARRIFQFVVANQQPDGSWFYLATDAAKGGSIIDGYHTGMILSALCEARDLGEEWVGPALERGGEFYVDRLFVMGKCRFATDREEPLDAYAVAQGILTLTDLGAVSTLNAVLGNSLPKILEKDGSVLYRRYRVGAIRLKSLRWAQALTIWSLARLLRRTA
jgi:hypothetical protein